MINVNLHFDSNSKHKTITHGSDIIPSVIEPFVSNRLELKTEHGSVTLYLSQLSLGVLKCEIDELIKKARENELILQQEKSEEEVNG